MKRLSIPGASFFYFLSYAGEKLFIATEMAAQPFLLGEE